MIAKNKTSQMTINQSTSSNNVPCFGTASSSVGQFDGDQTQPVCETQETAVKCATRCEKNESRYVRTSATCGIARRRSNKPVRRRKKHTRSMTQQQQQNTHSSTYVLHRHSLSVHAPNSAPRNALSAAADDQRPYCVADSARVDAERTGSGTRGETCGAWCSALLGPATACAWLSVVVVAAERPVSDSGRDSAAIVVDDDVATGGDGARVLGAAAAAIDDENVAAVPTGAINGTGATKSVELRASDVVGGDGDERISSDTGRAGCAAISGGGDDADDADVRSDDALIDVDEELCRLTDDDVVVVKGGDELGGSAV